MVKEIVLELVEKLTRIEGELKLLQDERKELFDDYKEKLDVKAFKAAVQVAKIRSKLGDSEIEMENILETVSKKITV